MRQRGNDPQQVAHFLNQCLFRMFAEDAGLLHMGQVEDPAIFTRILKRAGAHPDKAKDRIAQLFAAMQNKQGQYGDDDIAWFNGGLFKTIAIPPLTSDDLAVLLHAAEERDWRGIDPTIFGTLFERGLDPSARAPLGAHYTDVATIQKLIDPLITQPLTAEWEAAKPVIAKNMAIARQGTDKKRQNAAHKKAATAYQHYLERLRNFRVLDPACGSGNFLYLALRALKTLEQRAQNEAEALGLSRQITVETGPTNIHGLEINEYAAELARVTVWIGDIQWCREHGREIARDPILCALDGIQRRDALLTETGTEAAWPQADVIVGNPPFLGDKMMRGELGDAYVQQLRDCYKGRVPGGADLVTYWFEKARAQIEAGQAHAAGLVATNSIRGGANRKVLERTLATTSIFEAWSDEVWVNNGAAVRVSLICFGSPPSRAVGEGACQLDGQPVASIHADLTAGTIEGGMDLTHAKRLNANLGVSFQGPVLVGPFEVEGDTARAWLKQANPNERPNSDVLKPLTNGKDITSRSRGMWVVDFSARTEMDACLYESPFEYVLLHVKPTREDNLRKNRRERWWIHGETGSGWRQAIAALPRYIATSQVSKHRFFVWQPVQVWPHQTVIAIVRADDATFGILHSRFHELWALRLGTTLEDRPRYTPTTTFETFPFPIGMMPGDTATVAPCDAAAEAIASAARRLNELRNNWLNPPEWVDWVITPEEEKAGFPKRPVPKPGHESDLKKRTLTNLYNARPAWLDMAHKTIDRAVAAVYGWADYTPALADEEILRRLLALNLERAMGEKATAKNDTTEETT